MISYNNRLLLCLVILFCCCPVFQPCRANDTNRDDENSATFTKAELQTFYDSLQNDDKEFIDSLPPEEQTRILEIKAKFNKDRAPTMDTKKEVKFSDPVVIRSDKGKAYELDPLLKKAYLAYLDPNKPRKEIIPMFEAYIKKEPNSIFLPEISFRIGTLYCTHRKENFGESYDLKLASNYYEKAHKLYGYKFCYDHRTAWASLSNWPTATLDTRKAYYAWLQSLSQNISAEDIYPIRRISQVLKGFSPELDVEERAKVAEGLMRKESFSLYIEVAEKNIFLKTSNNYRELVDLATSYPDTGLGKQAGIRLKEMDKSLLESAELNNESVDNLAAKGIGASETLVKNTNAKIDDSSTVIDNDSNKDIEHTQSQETPPVASSGRWKVTVSIGLVGFCIAVALIVLTKY
jgi:hypothetical protein